MGIRVFHPDDARVLVPLIAKDARLIVWPGVGATFANMNYVNMEPGERNTPHTHPNSEDTIFVVSGKGTLEDLSNSKTYEVNEGQVVHVPPGITHAVAANRETGIESIGGPCPPDREMLRQLGHSDTA